MIYWQQISKKSLKIYIFSDEYHQISNWDISATTEPILIIFGALDQEKFTPSNKLISEKERAVLKM